MFRIPIVTYYTPELKIIKNTELFIVQTQKDRCVETKNCKCPIFLKTFVCKYYFMSFIIYVFY